MGSIASSNANYNETLNFLIEKAFKSTKYDLSMRHITYEEKKMIDLCILRFLETNRRIETKLLYAGKDEENLLDVLNY